MANMRRLVSVLSVAGLSLLLLTGCVPGGYSVDTLKQQPEAALVYPGSTYVQTDDYNGSPGNMFGKGAYAVTSKSGTTTHTQSEVIAYYTEKLAANGWTVVMDNPGATTAAGFADHAVLWQKAKLNLAYQVDAWTDGGTTKYSTQLSADG